jgi:DNA-directed RNA polymerase subunit RPC12/RpoP
MVDHNWYTMAEAASVAETTTFDRRARRRPLDDNDEPSSEERATIRRAGRMSFRTYCIACGRSTETPSAPSRLSRCAHCNGTMLIEPVTT